MKIIEDFMEKYVTGNAERKKVLEHLARDVHTKVVQIFASLEDLGSNLHDLCPQLNPVPPYNEDLSYDQNFKAMNDTFQQWQETIKLLQKEDPTSSSDVNEEVKKLADLIYSVDPHDKEETEDATRKLLEKDRKMVNLAILVATGTLISKRLGPLVVKRLVPLLGKSFVRAATSFLVDAATIEAIAVEEGGVEAATEGVVAAESESLLSGFGPIGMAIAVVVVLVDSLFTYLEQMHEKGKLEEAKAQFKQQYEKLEKAAPVVRTEARIIVLKLYHLIELQSKSATLA